MLESDDDATVALNALPNPSEPEAVFRYLQRHGIDDTLRQMRRQFLAVSEALLPNLDPGDHYTVAKRYGTNAALAAKNSPDYLVGLYVALSLDLTGEAILHHAHARGLIRPSRSTPYTPGTVAGFPITGNATFRWTLKHVHALRQLMGTVRTWPDYVARYHPETRH